MALKATVDINAHLSSFFCSFIIPMFNVLYPGFTSVQILNAKCILAVELRKFGFEMFDHEGIDILGSLGRHETFVNQLEPCVNITS